MEVAGSGLARHFVRCHPAPEGSQALVGEGAAFTWGEPGACPLEPLFSTISLLSSPT